MSLGWSIGLGRLDGRVKSDCFYIPYLLLNVESAA